MGYLWLGLLPMAGFFFLLVKYFFTEMRTALAVGLLGLLMVAAKPAARAQAPAWQSANLLTVAAAQYGSSIVRATAADANGNVYLVGEFIDDIYLGSTVLSAGSNQSLFIAKWSTDSNSFTWAHRVTGPNASLMAAAVAVSGNSIYVAGTFNGSAVDFGGTTVASNTSTDVFVAKFIDTGAAVSLGWIQQSTGSGDEQASSLALSGSNIYLTGTFGGSGVRGTALFGTTALVNSGSTTTDIFVAKLTDSGTSATFNWALRVGGSSDDVARAIAVNGPNIYLGGYVTGPMAFGAIATTTTINLRTGFLAKLVDTGTPSFSWVQLPQGQTEVYGLTVSGTSVYAAGEFNYSPLFGSVQLSTAGVLDGFVVKLMDAGTTSNFVWGYQFGNRNYDGARALAVIGRTLYVSGYFGNEIFLGCLTDRGSMPVENWTKKPSGSGGGRAYGVTVTSRGGVYIGGGVAPPVNFAPINFNLLRYSTIGFLASLTDPILLAITPAISTLSFILVPNPASSSTMVQLPALPGASMATLTLRDALGRAVRTATVALPSTGLRHEFSLAGLAHGLYALQVQTGKATATRKLVVE